MYEGDDQQSFKRSEVDKLSRHSGDNVKGYMGSASRGRASIWGEAMILASPLAAESQASEVNRLYDEEFIDLEKASRGPTLAVTSERQPAR